ncbi:hypothetical protein [Herbaspirillum sp. NPDC101397]|uniref:hypothetical protein n=1 Tax=Herbaspirillum sp. NPDC101397 TaxID=3364006 RepID=UPI00383AD7DA
MKEQQQLSKQALGRKEQLELLQQKMKQEEQAKQELQTKTGQQQAKSQPSATPDGKIVSPPRQQLLALLDPGNGKSSSALTTTGDVAIHLASGQGNRDAQAQIVASAVGTAVTGPAPTGSIPPEATMPSAGVTATGIAGISTGVAAVAAALGAAVSSSSDAGGAVQSALQQQQQQSAVTAAQQQAFSYVTANLVTPLASFPTSMQATYTGPVTGSASVGAGVTGTFQAQVDFATIRGGAPSVPGTITFANGLGGTSFTLTLMGGFVGGAMSGTYAGQAVTGFVMNGRFYGPAAEQLAGSWSMQNAGATLTGSGSFKAQR